MKHLAIEFHTKDPKAGEVVENIAKELSVGLNRSSTGGEELAYGKTGGYGYHIRTSGLPDPDAPKMIGFIVVFKVKLSREFLTTDTYTHQHAYVTAQNREHCKSVLQEKLHELKISGYVNPDRWIITPVTPLPDNPVAMLIENE